MGVRRAKALIGNARQATGKSGPVETGLTRPAATALPDHSNLLPTPLPTTSQFLQVFVVSHCCLSEEAQRAKSCNFVR